MVLHFTLSQSFLESILSLLYPNNCFCGASHKSKSGHFFWHQYIKRQHFQGPWRFKLVSKVIPIWIRFFSDREIYESYNLLPCCSDIFDEWITPMNCVRFAKQEFFSILSIIMPPKVQSLSNFIHLSNDPILVLHNYSTSWHCC